MCLRCAQQPEALTRLQSAELAEVSGLAASQRHPGTLWMVNDSGEAQLRVFAVDESNGLLRGTWQAERTPLDVEAVSLWPQPGAGPDLLLIGDIGDNAARRGGMARASIKVYLAEEPDPRAPGPLRLRSELELHYPDVPRDAEALFVDPRDQSLYLLSKETVGPSVLYRTDDPRTGARARRLERVGEVPVGTARCPGLMITAASVRADGGQIALRTYGTLLTFERAPGQSVHDALNSVATAWNAPAEPQGESVSYSHDQRALLTVSEGAHSALHRTALDCHAPAP